MISDTVVTESPAKDSAVDSKLGEAGLAQNNKPLSVNALCPCGSGRRIKNCCKRPISQGPIAGVWQVSCLLRVVQRGSRTYLVRSDVSGDRLEAALAAEEERQREKQKLLQEQKERGAEKANRPKTQQSFQREVQKKAKHILANPVNQAWEIARLRHHLSHVQVQMARELGMNPKTLGKIDNHKQERWKAPLPIFLEALYFRRFGRERPEQVLSAQERAQQQASKKVARKQRRQANRQARAAQSETRIERESPENVWESEDAWEPAEEIEARAEDDEIPF